MPYSDEITAVAECQGFGLGEDLVCTVQIHRTRRIKSLDIMGSTIEMIGKWRVAWNKAWLDAVGEQILDGEHSD